MIEVDIRKFFDTLDHSHLREILSQRVRDGVLLRLIGKWLNAGVMEAGELSYPEAGTPQGGVISPLLANIYLHKVLDKWFEVEVKPRLHGRAFLVRFADDFVIGFSNEADAKRESIRQVRTWPAPREDAARPFPPTETKAGWRHRRAGELRPARLHPSRGFLPTWMLTERRWRT